MLTCPHVAFLEDVCNIRTPAAVSQLLFMIGERQRCYSYTYVHNESEIPTTRTIQTNHIRAMNEACPYAFFIETAGAWFLSLRHDVMIHVVKTIV